MTGSTAITHQVLFYPSLDLDFDVDRYASLRENAEGYGLETAGLKPFNSFYLDSGADPADPLVSPIKREDLAGLPPALIITAEYDPLRDEGELYGRRLTEAGVDATVSRYAGANHGFVQNFSWIPEFYRAFQETGEFLNGTSPPTGRSPSAIHLGGTSLSTRAADPYGGATSSARARYPGHGHPAIHQEQIT